MTDVSPPPADPSSATTLSPAALQRALWRSAGLTLLFPMLLLLFFSLAPSWLEYRLHWAFEAIIQASTHLSPAQKQQNLLSVKQVNFERASQDDISLNYTVLHANLVRGGAAAHFKELAWAWYAACLLLALNILGLVVVYALNQEARMGEVLDPLLILSNFKIAWTFAWIIILLESLLSIPLLTFAAYEFTVLFFDFYSEKIIFAAGFFGVVVLFACLRALTQKFPAGFDCGLCREVTPEEAPELWEIVRAAAKRLDAPLPEQILVGMSFNFFVTEVPVHFGQNKTHGRTLYFSYLLIRYLSEEELSAIIGHELAHFSGGDTRITREFSPLKRRLELLWASLNKEAKYYVLHVYEFVRFFYLCFSVTEQELSRQREVRADALGAQLSSPRAMAAALVKIHVYHDAFGREWQNHAAAETVLNLSSLDLKQSFQTAVASETEYWPKFFRQTVPHPLDSHPPVGERLRSLGQTTDAAEVQALIAHPALAPDWLTAREHLFTDLVDRGQANLKKDRLRTQLTQAVYDSKEGREMLETHFPEIRWTYKPTSWVEKIAGSFFALLALAALVSLFFAPALWPVLVIAVIVCTFCAVSIYLHAARRHGGELVLNAQGVTSTLWRQPLWFSDVVNVGISRKNGRSSLIVRFKQQRGFATIGQIFMFNKTYLIVPLDTLQGKPMEIAQTIFRYLHRRIE